MPLLYREADGYSPEDAATVWTEISATWREYIEDCRIADTKATVVDFSVWLIHVKGFIDGVSIGSDRGEDGHSTLEG